jgi:flagellar hook-basal body complex protein FliE
LSHVKATMKMHRGKSFKQVLKLAKKSYKKSQSSSQSQSQSGGRRRKSRVSKRGKRGQRGGSAFAENAAAYPN